MSSKAFALLGLLFAIVLLISSEVSARDLAQTSTEKNNEVTAETNGIEDAKYGGGYDRGYGGGRGGYGGRRGYGGGGYGRGRGGYGGRCRYGCCGYGGRCGRCCSYAGEVADAEP